MTASPDRAGRTTVTSENAAGAGTFSMYRKVATTRISDFTVPPGIPYQTPEGLRAEDEETRIAFDVQGGVYPIRESVFRASYALAATGDSDPELDNAIVGPRAAALLAATGDSEGPLDDIRSELLAVVVDLPQPTLGLRGGVNRGEVIDAINRVFAARLSSGDAPVPETK